MSEASELDEKGIKMKVRYLGHSCVEIVGRYHILIDPDFTRDPEPSVECILGTHAHNDHIGRVAEVPTGLVLAAPDVCDIAARMGTSQERSRPVAPGDQIANIRVLPIHHDMPPTDADPAELHGRLKARILEGQGWHVLGQNPPMRSVRLGISPLSDR